MFFLLAQKCLSNFSKTDAFEYYKWIQEDEERKLEFETRFPPMEDNQFINGMDNFKDYDDPILLLPFNPPMVLKALDSMYPSRTTREKLNFVDGYGRCMKADFHIINNWLRNPTSTLELYHGDEGKKTFKEHVERLKDYTDRFDLTVPEQLTKRFVKGTWND